LASPSLSSSSSSYSMALTEEVSPLSRSCNPSTCYPVHSGTLHAGLLVVPLPKRSVSAECFMQNRHNSLSSKAFLLASGSSSLSKLQVKASALCRTPATRRTNTFSSFCLQELLELLQLLHCILHSTVSRDSLPASQLTI
jgi:hypothetical protein